MNDLERHMMSKQLDKLTRQLAYAVQRFAAANDEIKGRHQRSNNFRAGIETGARLVV